MCVCILTYILCLYKLYIFTYILYIYIYSFTSFKLLLRFQRPYQIQVLFFFFFCMKTSLVVLCTSHYMPSGSTHCPVVSSLVVLWYCGITKDSYINVWSNAYRLPLSLSFKGSVSCWTFEWVNCFYLGFQNDDVVLFLLFLSIAILL